MIWLSIAIGLLVVPIVVSYLLEAIRPAPTAPEHLPWAPTVPVRYIEVDGMRLRYVAVGDGPALVLLHTLRTQLDMFQKVIPTLATRFRVYALDFPGHGYSDIPKVAYSAEFFVTTVAKALDRLDVKDATFVGESIGGSIALLLAARHNPRVRRVVAINPYDYDGGRGIRRSSALANLLFGLNDVPVLGATVNRLRLYPIVRLVFEGGIHRKGALPAALAREMYLVGNRRGHYRALMSLVRNWESWEVGRAEYRSIDRPTLLLYGDHDWSRDEERVADSRAIPGAELRVIKNAGHFLSLDAPDEMTAAILSWEGWDGQVSGGRRQSGLRAAGFQAAGAGQPGPAIHQGPGGLTQHGSQPLPPGSGGAIVADVAVEDAVQAAAPGAFADGRLLI
jgi:pimeloyl-ACP methyl ester carboxylesterase